MSSTQHSFKTNASLCILECTFQLEKVKDTHLPENLGVVFLYRDYDTGPKIETLFYFLAKKKNGMEGILVSLLRIVTTVYLV